MLEVYAYSDNTEITSKVEKAVYYAISVLLPKTRALSVEVEIEPMGEWEHGYCHGVGGKYYEISVNSDLSEEDIIKTVLHEMVHVKQYHKGELSLKKQEKVWRGAKWEGEDYREFPWELEAYELEEELYLGFINQ